MGRKRVVSYFPTISSCDDIQINVFPCTTVVHEVNWRSVVELRKLAVFSDVGLGRLVSHADEFIGWFLFIVSCLHSFWQCKEVILCSVV